MVDLCQWSIVASRRTRTATRSAKTISSMAATVIPDKEIRVDSGAGSPGATACGIVSISHSSSYSGSVREPTLLRCSSPSVAPKSRRSREIPGAP